MAMPFSANEVLFWSLCLFAAVYSFGYRIIFKDWKGRHRKDAANCGMSLLHGLVASYLAGMDVLYTDWQFDGHNTPHQNDIMDFSISYFLMDLLTYVLVGESHEDFLFVAHHLATVTYLISCRYYASHGAASVMCLLALGECTSPLQNVWTLARLAREGSSMARCVYTFLSPCFTLVFTFVRGVIGPLLAWEIGCFYLGGRADNDAVIPQWLVCCWTFKIVFALFGSMLWVYKLWMGLFRFDRRSIRRERSSATDGCCDGTINRTH